MKNVKYMTSKKMIPAVLFLIAFVLIFSNIFTQQTEANGTISGTVYIDYNMNGVNNTTGTAPNLAIDGGLAGVTVTAYAADGSSKTATTSSTGAYSINTTIAPSLPAGPYRIEFTNLPLGYYPSTTGTNNATTVRFAADGNSSANDLGVIVPSDYCQINPFMAHNVYNVGPGASDTVVKFPYNYSEELDGRLNIIDPTAWVNPPSRTSLLNPTGVAIVDEVGSTFGLTFDSRSSKLYTSAYLKRGANFGSPGESTGAIYVTNNPAGTAPTTTLYANLNSIFTATTAGANPHPTATTTDWTADTATIPLVGKIGLGGLKVSLDGTKLYTVNLNDRRLYVIPTSGTLNSTTVTRFDIPTTGLATSSGTCATADVRPFAVGRDRTGQIYVGAVCSAESETADTKLHVFIWRFTGSAFTLVANNNLTFTRTASTTETVSWQRWANTTGVISRSAPMLTDIEFEGADMILGLRDRYGDQVVLPDYFRGYGDIMRVCNVSGTFTFESNGTCGGVTSTNPGSNGNTGNGGREFYSDLNGDGRQEGGLGGLTQIPGYNHVITSFYDPVTFNSAGARVNNYYTSGIQRYNNTTGALTGAYDVYLDADPGNFGKANGSGDTEALCDAAPLQIGNRVWTDTNGNGRQDPGENGIQNVAVQLWEDTNGDGTVDAQVASVNTNSSGEYVFGSLNCTPLTATSTVSLGTDDAEQTNSNGAMVLTGNSLDIVQQGTTLQTLGLRFQNLNIPSGAVITSAKIQFTTNTTTTNNTVNALIQGQAADNAGTFTTTANNISSRARTATGVNWNSIPAWTSGTSGSAQQTPDLTAIVQELVNRGGWASGNSMAFIMTDFGSTSGASRSAFTFESGTAAQRPILTVTYSSPTNGCYNVKPNTKYEVRLPATNFNSGQALNNLAPTTPFADATANGTLRDSNGVVLSGNQVVAALTTGDIGQNDHTYDFGFRLAASAYSIGNRLWYDTNNNGIIDAAEVGISGVSVSVFLDANSDGQPDTPASPLGTVTTDTNGYYRFDGLAAGNYVVRINPSNFTSGGVLINYANTSGNNTANIDSSGAAVNAENGINPAIRNSVQTNGILSNTVTLNASSPTAEPDIPTMGSFAGQGTLDNQSNATIDFGFYNLSLSGTVWNDTSVAGNNDGILNNGETGIPGAVVLLYDSGNVEIPVGLDGILGTADDDTGGMLTNASGNYNFQGLAPGTFRVVINSSGGGTSSTPTQTNADNNVDNDDNGFPDNTGNFPNRIISGLVVLTAGGEPIVNNANGSTSNPTVDFGFILAPTIVKLDSFDVYSESDGSVTVKWATASEDSNLGFNVYREAGGKRERINTSPIAGTALRSAVTLVARSAGYSWTDNNPVTGAVYYLEDIDMKGIRTMHGPFAPKIQFSSYSKKTNSSLLSDLTKLSKQSKQVDSTAKYETSKNIAKDVKNNRFNLAEQRGVKIAVRSDGWYRVSLAELTGAGFETNSNSDNWQLFADGEEVPFHIDTNGSVEFYGHGLDTLETDRQVYYLVNGDSPRQHLPETDGGNVEKRNDAAYFRNTATIKDRSLYFSGIINGDEGNWFGSPIYNGSVSIYDLGVYNPAAQGLAHIKIRLQGVTITNHTAQLRFNNLELGVLSLENLDNEVFEFDVPMSAVLDGNNQITISGNGSDEAVAAVDEVSLTYERQYFAHDNKLVFSVPAGNTVKVGGFDNANISVLEISNGQAVRRLSVQTEQTENGFAFSLNAAGNDREFLALTDSQINPAVSVVPYKPSNWRDTKNKADFIIIAPESFRETADYLASVRKSVDSLRTVVVPVEDIYDEFNFGTTSVSAVKEFLRTANDSWTIRPKFVLLLGDSSYDPRNYLSQPDRNLVPTRLFETQLLETSSDSWIADFDDDGIEDIAIGRLPVATEAEAAQMVEKITRRPKYDNVRDERSNLFIADSGFDANAENLRATLPANVNSNVIKRSELDNKQILEQILRQTNEGRTVITYIGHGSTVAWSNSYFFNTNDAESLTNEKLSFYMLMTCLNGYTIEVYGDSLAESLMRSQGGAYAVWVSSGVTNTRGQNEISQAATDLIFKSNKPLRIGDIARLAKRKTQDAEIRKTWQLIGDPTMFVR